MTDGVGGISDAVARVALAAGVGVDGYIDVVLDASVAVAMGVSVGVAVTVAAGTTVDSDGRKLI